MSCAKMAAILPRKIYVNKNIGVQLFILVQTHILVMSPKS